MQLQIKNHTVHKTVHAVSHCTENSVFSNNDVHAVLEPLDAPLGKETTDFELYEYNLG